MLVHSHTLYQRVCTARNLHISSSSEQKPHDVDVTPANGLQERRVLIVIAGVDVSLGGDEHLDTLDPPLYEHKKQL